MDRERFDALARLLGRAGSRRAALGALAGAAVGAGAMGVSAKKGKKKKKKKKAAQPLTCFGTLLCEFPSDGQDFENCDLSGTNIGHCNGCNFRRADLSETDLREGGFQGVSFRNANLSYANLEDADVSGASFRDACLYGASFFGANIDGADFRGALLCGTTLPDGSIDDSGCDDVDACCPSAQSVCTAGCLKDADCPLGSVCCDGVCCGGIYSCEPRASGGGSVCVDIGVGGCSEPCVKDADCPAKWACVDDGFCDFNHCHPLCGVVIEVARKAAGKRRGH
jgi:hypothetical protein